MNELNQILGYSVPLWAVLVYWVVMAMISNLPMPKEGERFYSWVFGTLHSIAANVERARVGFAKAKNGNGGSPSIT